MKYPISPSACQVEPADRHRHIVMLGLVAERAGHPAAARLDGLDLELGNHLQHLLHRGEGAGRLLMAMAVHQRPVRGERL